VKGSGRVRESIPSLRKLRIEEIKGATGKRVFAGEEKKPKKVSAGGGTKCEGCWFVMLGKNTLEMREEELWHKMAQLKGLLIHYRGEDDYRGGNQKPEPK